MSYLCLPTISATIFQVFVCEDVGDGSTFLKADYNINCSSGRYKSNRAFAWCMVLVYPVGVPLAYFLLLLVGRREGSSLAQYAEMVRVCVPLQIEIAFSRPHIFSVFPCVAYPQL